jgi:hypothetical protein
MTNPTRIPHDGSACPVSPGTKVGVWFRSGSYDGSKNAGQPRWEWGSEPNTRDVLFYAILEPRTALARIEGKSP